ncbi:MAG: DUF63 family protein [archaeon]
MTDFIQDFFINPITQHSGYNPVNTVVYAIIGILLAFYVIYPILNKKGVKFDFKFVIALLPYIVFGSALRIFEESYSAIFLWTRSYNPLELGFYTLSPGIYFLMIAIVLISIGISFLLKRYLNWDWLKTFTIIGLILAIPMVIHHLLFLTHPLEFLFIPIATLILSFVVIKVFDLTKISLLKNNLNKLVLISQTLDATATVTALTFFTGFGEQHFLSRTLMDTFTPYSFIVVKIALALIAVYFIDKWIKDENLNHFIKLFIIILGFATGTRDTFSVGLTLLN